MGLPIVTDEAHIRWITIDRPEVANALRIEDLDHIADAVRGVDETTRAIAFTGSGDRAFSAGMHLDTFRAGTPATARRLIGRVGDFLRATRQSPVPTVAMLNGVCLGAAFELALACDIRIARPGVRVGLPEVKLGIPSVADAALLPGFVGLAKAREIILTGDLYDIAELGSAFANRVVEPDRLRAETERMLATLTAPTRQVIAAQKRLFETWLDSGISTSVATSVDVFGDLFADPATNEAIEAYRASTRRAG
jgi:enoyl-CoA hydratase